MPPLPPNRVKTVTTLVARFALAGVFLWAAVPKLLEPAAFTEAITNYHVLPRELVAPAALLVPALEICVALALVAGPYSQGAALLAALTLVGFTAAMASAMARGIDVSCGCFGSSVQSEIGPANLLRNAALIALAAWILFTDEVRWKMLGPRHFTKTPQT